VRPFAWICEPYDEVIPDQPYPESHRGQWDALADELNADGYVTAGGQRWTGRDALYACLGDQWDYYEQQGWERDDIALHLRALLASGCLLAWARERDPTDDAA
jgi:hypothetical protein